MYLTGTLERLVLSDRNLVTYVPLPATSSESVPVIHVLVRPKMKHILSFANAYFIITIKEKRSESLL